MGVSVGERCAFSHESSHVYIFEVIQRSADEETAENGTRKGAEASPLQMSKHYHNIRTTCFISHRM
jgi:hypothetical protein